MKLYLIGDGEAFVSSNEEWFEILLEKYQIEYGVNQHEQHDGDMILSILQDKSIKNNINVINSEIDENRLTTLSDEINLSELKTDRSISTSILTSNTTSSTKIPKKILRKCRPQLNLFCAYYASCLMGEIDCTEKEWSALMKVDTFYYFLLFLLF